MPDFRIIAEVMGIAIKLTSETEADLNVQFSGHVNTLYVRAYLSGWHCMAKAEMTSEIDFDKEENSEQLLVLLATLKLLATEKGIEL